MVTTEWIVASPRISSAGRLLLSLLQWCPRLALWTPRISSARRLFLRGFRIEAKRREGPQGFTMMETLVALSLFTVVLLGTLAGVGTVIRANSQGGKTARAMLLAQEKMEQLRVGGYGALASGSDAVGSFSRSWTVVAGPLADTRRVDIAVTWTVPRSGNISLTTLLNP